VTVELDQQTIRLKGDCPIEDAEPLLALLQDQAGYVVDISDMGLIHTAILQLLIALRPKVIGPSRDSFTNLWIIPLLDTVNTE
jgi:hypothetical protein